MNLIGKNVAIMVFANSIVFLGYDKSDEFGSFINEEERKILSELESGLVCLPIFDKIMALLELKRRGAPVTLKMILWHVRF